MNLEKNQYSSYVSQDTVDDFRGIEKGNFSFKKFFISSIAAFFMVALAFQPLLFSVVESFNFSKDTAVTASQTQSENVYAFCGAGGDIGGGMSSKASWNGLINNMPNPDQGGSRIFTLQSGYSRGLGIVNYHGEGDGGGSWGVTPASERPSSVKSVIDSADYKALLEERRTLGNCVFNFGPIVGNTLLGASDLLLTFSSAITSMAINPTIICDSQENNDGKFCIPLTEIIGGSGDSDRGILGTLFDGVYMPLMTMAAIITGIWFMWSGLARRKFREAFIGLGKAILIFFISLFISTNTATLVNFPVKATGAITSCVVGAFSGENCFDNSSTKSGGSEIVVDSSKVCESTSSASAFSSGMSHTVDRLNCQIWKSFVLEPYSRMQFGQSFEDLDTKSGPTADFISEKKLKSPDDGSTISGDTFCVNLSTTTAPNSMKRRLSTTSSTKVCNLAAYQMMLRVETTDDGPHMEAGPEGGSKIDKRWYNIVAVTAKSNQGEDSSEDSVNLWTSWAPSGVSGFTNALNYGIMSALGSLVISIIQIVIGFTTLLFLISSILLMIFAPIFLLIGFIPGRGMSIFLGWVEQITSNILKYLISMVFLIASVSILGAALGASSNTFEALILLAILGLALLLYRGEIVNMLGRANMGGTQLSDKFSQSMKGGLKRTGRAASVVGGSALGGAFAGQKPHTAAFEGVKRELSRGNGFVANTIRQNERFHTAKDKEAKEIQNNLAEGVNNSQAKVEDSVRNFESKEREVGDNAKDIKANNAVIENANNAVSGNVAAAEEILINLKVENSTGADYVNRRTQLETEAANLNAEFQNAINSGDATQDEIDDIERRMDINRRQFEDLENFDDLSDDEIADIERAKSELSADTRWKDLDPDSFDKVKDAIYDNAILQDENERIALEQEGLADQIIAQREEVAEEELRRYYHDQVTDEMRQQRGGKLKAGDLKKIDEEANRRFEADSLYTTNPDGSRTVEYAMDSEGNYDLEAMRNSDKASERAKAEIIEERMDFNRSLKQMDGIVNRNDNISKVKTFDDFGSKDKRRTSGGDEDPNRGGGGPSGDDTSGGGGGPSGDDTSGGGGPSGNDYYDNPIPDGNEQQSYSDPEPNNNREDERRDRNQEERRREKFEDKVPSGSDHEPLPKDRKDQPEQQPQPNSHQQQEKRRRPQKDSSEATESGFIGDEPIPNASEKEDIGQSHNAQSLEPEKRAEEPRGRRRSEDLENEETRHPHGSSNNPRNEGRATGRGGLRGRRRRINPDNVSDIVDSSSNPNRIDRKREGGWTGSSRQDIPEDTRVPDDSPRDSEGDQSRENGGENSEVFPTDETFDGDR